MATTTKKTKPRKKRATPTPIKTPIPTRKCQAGTALVAVWNQETQVWRTVSLPDGSVTAAAPMLLAWYPEEEQALKLINGGIITDLEHLEFDGKKHRAIRRWDKLVEIFDISGAEWLYALTDYEQWTVHSFKENGRLKSRRLADLLGLESEYHAESIKGLQLIDPEEAEPGDFCLYRCGGAWSMDEIQKDGYFPDREWLGRWAQKPKYFKRGSGCPASFRK